MQSVVKKIKKKLVKLMFQPIEVFVFHSVSDEFDESQNLRSDWSSTQAFQEHVGQILREYHFISIEEAYRHLRKDWMRRKRYAVMTCDDGFRSVLSVLPFLESHNIPLTLFVNTQYLDGVSKREGYAANPQYITQEELDALDSPLITIGMHGHLHDNVADKSEQQFVASLKTCEKILQKHPRYVPFFAYTWGSFSKVSQQVLKKNDIIPVFSDGESNYHYSDGVSRRAIDSVYWRSTARKILG